jgi:peroxiredoxin Q/BCP
MATSYGRRIREFVSIGGMRAETGSGGLLLLSLKPWRTEEMAEETKPPVVLAPGSPAPHFSLPGRSGNSVSLADFAGKNVVLVYFYPKDDTPGCTKEACSLRDGWGALKAAEVVVLGISRDGAEAHNAFASKYDLPFELLTDADHAVHEAYGAWGQNPNPIWGVGPLRKSFLIGKDGNVLHVFTKVDTEHHADQVLQALGAPASSAPAANVGGAVKDVVEAVKKVAGEVRKTQVVKKAEKAVRNAETAVSQAVDDVARKPAVKKAARAVKQAVADAKKKPAVKKAAKAVRKAVADVKAGVKAGVKNVKKAIADARKKKPVKNAAKPAKGKTAPKAKKAPARKAVKPARKPAKKTVKKAVRKAVKKPAARPAPKKAKPAPKKKAAKGKGRR